MDDYNLLDYEFNNEFNFDFEENSKKEEDNLEENYIERPVFDNNLEYNTFKPHYSSFKYCITPKSTQYLTLEVSQIELLLPLTQKPSGYDIFNLSTLEALTPSLFRFS